MNAKDWFQYSSAAAMLASGVVLSFLSFFIRGDVTDNVLLYVGECIMFAGGIFGVTIYFNSKGQALLAELKKELQNLIKGTQNENLPTSYTKD